MGVRVILWLAIALLAVYVAVQLYRASRIGRRTASTDLGPAAIMAPAGEQGAAANDDGEVFVFESPWEAPTHPDSTAAAATTDASAFQSELEVRQLRRDVALLQAELAEQRSAIADLEARLRTQQEQLDAGLATQGASPEYNEALVFARRGFDVEAIAERCGITVAEAALVRALAQGETGEAGDRP